MDPVQVHRHWVHGEQITMRLPEDPRILAVRQRPAQSIQISVQSLPGALRRALRPYMLDQLVGGDYVVGVDQQRDQHALLPGVA